MSKISEKIMKIYEDNETVIYRSSCDCGDTSDDLTMIIGIDDTYELLSLCLCGEFNFGDDFVCSCCNFLVRWFGHFKNFIRRIKTAVKLIFTGRLEQQYEFIFSDEKHINEFLKALNEGISTLKSKKKNTSTS